MPGTTCREDWWTTKAFQKASSGRGSQVTITVSSMSLISPTSASGGTTVMSAVTSLPGTVHSTAWWWPGGRETSRWASTMPERSARTVNSWSPRRTCTVLCGAT